MHSWNIPLRIVPVDEDNHHAPWRVNVDPYVHGMRRQSTQSLVNQWTGCSRLPSFGVGVAVDSNTALEPSVSGLARHDNGD
jgi:hypothetical protein